VSEKDIRQYVLHGASGDSKEDKSLAEAVNTKLSIKHKKLLNLSKDWLKSFLPHGAYPRRCGSASTPVLG
jgi:hypothetical protein